MTNIGPPFTETNSGAHTRIPDRQTTTNRLWNRMIILNRAELRLIVKAECFPNRAAVNRIIATGPTSLRLYTGWPTRTRLNSWRHLWTWLNSVGFDVCGPHRPDSDSALASFNSLSRLRPIRLAAASRWTCRPTQSIDSCPMAWSVVVTSVRASTMTWTKTVFCSSQIDWPAHSTITSRSSNVATDNYSDERIRACQYSATPFRRRYWHCTTYIRVCLSIDVSPTLTVFVSSVMKSASVFSQPTTHVPYMSRPYSEN